MFTISTSISSCATPAAYRGFRGQYSALVSVGLYDGFPGQGTPKTCLVTQWIVRKWRKGHGNTYQEEMIDLDSGILAVREVSAGADGLDEVGMHDFSKRSPT